MRKVSGWNYEIIIMDTRFGRKRVIRQVSGCYNFPAITETVDALQIIEEMADEVDYDKNYCYRFGNMWYVPQRVRVYRQFCPIFGMG